MTIKELQQLIKNRDYHPDLVAQYFMKLGEEVGELSRAIRKDLKRDGTSTIKNTIDEEIYDVIYYALALANICGVDVEATIIAKEKLNDEKYKR